MINEQEKKATISKMSDLEYAKNDVEMMRYRANGLSNKLGLLGMAFSVLGMFICLNSFKPTDIQVLLSKLNYVLQVKELYYCGIKEEDSEFVISKYYNSGN